MFEAGQTVKHPLDYIKEHVHEDHFVSNWRGEIVYVNMRKLTVLVEDEYGYIDTWRFHEVELADD